jgi:hypothetical protein
LRRLEAEAGSAASIYNDAIAGGAVLVGFDFPIGLPQSYAERAGIDNFLTFLDEFRAGRWAEFDQVAEHPQQISLQRPFYPLRPGHARLIHLLEGLGVDTLDRLRRICERARPGRRAAAPLFWTMGGQQVGKAALHGWREVLNSPASIWPFHGRLVDLLHAGQVVIAETYPAEFYSHLGVKFSSRLAGHKSGKRSPGERAGNAAVLAAWAERAQVKLDPTLMGEIEAGFGSKDDGEDRFDAVIGLFGMLNVVLGFQPAGEPGREVLRKIEGWILGQRQPEDAL